MNTFSEYALEKMLDLYNNHSHEVGSELKKSDPETYKDYVSTNCITYVINVLSYAFEKRNNTGAASKVRKLGHKGTELAQYLVNQQNWAGIYINPDVNHPTDSDNEHTYSAYLANKRCAYYGISLSYKVTNYATTPKTHHAFQTVSKRKGVTELDNVAISELRKIGFGFGLSRGGTHTWLYSKGQVYEVHWKGIGSDLYEASPISKYEWLSGAIVVPLDQTPNLTTASSLVCKS